MALDHRVAVTLMRLLALNYSNQTKLSNGKSASLVPKSASSRGVSEGGSSISEGSSDGGVARRLQGPD